MHMRSSPHENESGAERTPRDHCGDKSPSSPAENHHAPISAASSNRSAYKVPRAHALIHACDLLVCEILDRKFSACQQFEQMRAVGEMDRTHALERAMTTDPGVAVQ